jgi:hypothetical protein
MHAQGVEVAGAAGVRGAIGEGTDGHTALCLGCRREKVREATVQGCGVPSPVVVVVHTSSIRLLQTEQAELARRQGVLAQQGLMASPPSTYTHIRTPPPHTTQTQIHIASTLSV